MDAEQKPNILTTFLAETLDSIEEYVEEAIEGLEADIEYYSSEDDS